MDEEKVDGVECDVEKVVKKFDRARRETSKRECVSNERKVGGGRLTQKAIRQGQPHTLPLIQST